VTETLVLPSSADPVVGGAVEAIGGRPGRHARVGERRFWTPIRVLIVLTLLTSVFGYAQKLPCRDGSNWVNEYQYTRACYTDVIALYGAEGLSAGQTPYYEHPVEYPVVIGAVMQLSSLMTRATATVLPDDDRQTAARRALAAAKTPEDQAKAQGSVSYADGLARSRYFYDITWLILTACALVVVVLTARTAGRRPWDAALFALAPGLLIHATTNWDLLAMALAAAGLLSWSRKRPVLAGVWFGLATATKLYPVLFLAPLLFLCLRAGKGRTWLATALATVAVAVGVTAPVYLTAPSFADVGGQQTKVLASPLDRLGDEGLSALRPVSCRLTYADGVRFTAGDCPDPVPAGATAATAVNSVYRFFQLNKTRGADWDSLYFQAKKLHTENGVLKGPRNTIAGWFDDSGPVPVKLNRWVAVLELLVIAGLGVLILKARRRPRVPQVLFLGIVGFLLANKVDSPQYVLWLLPLAALANPRWRPFLAWQAAEVLVLGTRFYFFIGNDKPGEGIGQSWFFGAVLLRDLLLLVFSGYVVRDILRPDRDPVRADGADDPAGGVLDGASDRRDALALA
jgi:uncharacterized membrane protein